MRTTENSYWNGTGRFQKQADILHEIISEKMIMTGAWQGRLPSVQKGGQNYHLERFRRMQNAYYRLNNDGDNNSVFSDIQGLKERNPNATWSSRYGLADCFLDERIQLAWQEQRNSEAFMLKGLRQLIDYNWSNEQQHYFEEGEPANHIFPVLQQLNHYLETRENKPA